jgi:cell division protein FtsB
MGDKMKARYSDMIGKISGKKIFIGVVIFAFGGVLVRSAYKYFDMKSQRDAVVNEIEQLKEDNAKLQDRINNLYNDKEFVEKSAREQLNLVKDGETVFIISRD